MNKHKQIKGHGYVQKNLNGKWDIVSCTTGETLLYDVETSECHAMLNGNPFVNLKENGIEEDGKENIRCQDGASKRNGKDNREG